MSQHLRRSQKITAPARLAAAKKCFKRLMMPKHTPSEASSERPSSTSSKTPKGQSLIASQGKLVIKVNPQKGKGTAKSTSTTPATSTGTSTITTTVTATAKGTKVATSAHVQQKKQPRKKVVAANDSSSEESGAEVQYDDDSDDSLQESSAEGEGDVELLPQEGLRWGQFYRDLKARDATTRGHCFQLLQVSPACGGWMSF